MDDYVDEDGWLTFEVQDGPTWANHRDTIFLPFPRAVVHILARSHPDFTPTQVIGDMDDLGQYTVSLLANYYGQLKFKWTGVGITFEDAQRALVKYMDGWWFEADL